MLMIWTTEIYANLQITKGARTPDFDSCCSLFARGLNLTKESPDLYVSEQQATQTHWMLLRLTLCHEGLR
jgi:hypothetical protein